MIVIPVIVVAHQHIALDKVQNPFKVVVPVAKLVALIDETQGVSVIFITAKLDSRLIDGISEASSLINNVSSSGAVELFYYNPTDCILDPAEKERHKELAESCKAQLSTKGVTVAELRI